MLTHSAAAVHVQTSISILFISNFSECTKGAISHLDNGLMTSGRGGGDPSRDLSVRLFSAAQVCDGT